MWFYCVLVMFFFFFFFSSRRRHTRCSRDWSSDVCSSDLDSRLVQGARCSGTDAEGEYSEDARGNLSTNKHFQNDRLSHSQDACSSRLPGAFREWTVSSGG